VRDTRTTDNARTQSKVQPKIRMSIGLIAAGAPTPVQSISVDAACVLEEDGAKIMQKLRKKDWGRGKKIKLRKRIFALYALPVTVSLSQIFATLARLH